MWMLLLLLSGIVSFFFFFKQKTAYDMRISDWSSDVCSSDLHNQRAIFGFGGQSHFQAKRTHLLVQRRIEVTNTRTMRLAATDEDGSATVAVTSGATTLLSTELLAGARHIRALPRRASRSTALFKQIGRAHV